MPVLKYRDPSTGGFITLGYGSVNEVTVDNLEPSDGSELWLDTGVDPVTLRYWDAVTESYQPVPGGAGGGEGANEVTISPTAPIDGSELWLNTATATLMYLEGGGYVTVPAKGPAGGDLSGTYPNPSIKAGTIVDADVSTSADILESKLKLGRQVTDWNSINESGFYWSTNTAANNPVDDLGSDYFCGIATVYTTSWIHVIAWPIGQSNRHPSQQMFGRAKQSGSWSSWWRTGLWMWSYGTGDSMHYFQHGSDGADKRRFSAGMKKYTGTANPSESDLYVVRVYDTTGTYRGDAMRVAESGAVTFPYALMAAQARAPVSSDMVATVGLVTDMVVSALERLGLLTGPIPANLMGLVIEDAQPATDPEGEKGP